MRFVQTDRASSGQNVYTEFTLQIPVGTYRADWERMYFEANEWCAEQFGPARGAAWFSTGPFYLYICDTAQAAAFKMRWC